MSPPETTGVHVGFNDGPRPLESRRGRAPAALNDPNAESGFPWGSVKVGVYVYMYCFIYIYMYMYVNVRCKRVPLSISRLIVYAYCFSYTFKRISLLCYQKWPAPESKQYTGHQHAGIDSIDGSPPNCYWRGLQHLILLLQCLQISTVAHRGRVPAKFHVLQHHLS